MELQVLRVHQVLQERVVPQVSVEHQVQAVRVDRLEHRDHQEQAVHQDKDLLGKVFGIV
jgi:hypothetical protein